MKSPEPRPFRDAIAAGRKAFGSYEVFGLTVSTVIYAILALALAAFVGGRLWQSHEMALHPVTAQPAAQKVQTFSPVVSAPVVQVPDQIGACFKTPMGDIGKASAQANDMLTLTLSSGAKTSYFFDQLTPFVCGPAAGVAHKP